MFTEQEYKHLEDQRLAIMEVTGKRWPEDKIHQLLEGLAYTLGATIAVCAPNAEEAYGVAGDIQQVVAFALANTLLATGKAKTQKQVFNA